VVVNLEDIQKIFLDGAHRIIASGVYKLSSEGIMRVKLLYCIFRKFIGIRVQKPEIPLFFRAFFKFSNQTGPCDPPTLSLGSSIEYHSEKLNARKR